MLHENEAGPSQNRSPPHPEIHPPVPLIIGFEQPPEGHQPMPKSFFARERRSLARQDALTNLGTLFLVLLAAGIGLLILWQFNDSTKDADAREHARYAVDATLVAVAADVPPAATVEERRAAMAMAHALERMGGRSGEAKFTSRDAVLAPALDEVSGDPEFPTLDKVAGYELEAIRCFEDSIRLADVDLQRLLRSSAGSSDRARTERVEAKRNEIESLIRQREYTMDHVRLAAAGLPNQQSRFLRLATDQLDRALACRYESLAASAAKPSFMSHALAAASKPEHTLHVVWEAAWYVALVVVVLAIAFCSAIMLRLLPIPGAADKWSDNVTETFIERRKSERESPVASWLLSATVLGIGAIAATHAMRQQPGSPLYQGSLGELLPAGHATSGGDTHVSTSVSAPVTVQGRLASPPWMQNLAFTAFSYSNLNPAQVTYHAEHHIDAIPGPIEGLGELQSGIRIIGEEAAKTSAAVDSIDQALGQERKKTEQLTNVVSSASAAWSSLGEKVTAVGTQVRGSLATADYNGEQRFRYALEHESVSQTRHWWRHLFVLSHYRVNPNTRIVFAAEAIEEDPTQHRMLERALKDLDGSNDPSVPADYGGPFEARIIQKMLGDDPAAMKDPARFLPARTEVRKHLPVIFETSRIAE
jgi:hypothetical protein